MQLRSPEELHSAFQDGFPILQNTADKDYTSLWFTAFESRCKHHDIPPAQWVEAAMQVIDDALRAALSGKENIEWSEWRKLVIERRQVTVSTQTNKTTLQQLKDALASVKDAADNFRAENPRLATASGVVLVIGSSAVLVPAAEAALLASAGFGTLGPVAGTLAPWIQSVFYGARTGGLFSLLQSAGMTITAPAAFSTAVAAFTASAGAWLGFPPPNSSNDGDNSNNTDTSSDSTETGTSSGDNGANTGASN